MSDRTDGSRAAIRASLVRTIGTLRRVIADNRRLADLPGHEDSAAQRIADGEAELARAEVELAHVDGDAAADAPRPPR